MKDPINTYNPLDLDEIKYAYQTLKRQEDHEDMPHIGFMEDFSPNPYK